MRATCDVAVPVLIAGLLAGCLTAQRTWIVAPAGGDFDDLQTAIIAASPGDTLLLRGGSYSGVVVDRSLQLVGDQPRPVVSTLTCWPGTTVSLSRLDVHFLGGSSCTLSSEGVTSTSVQLNGVTGSFVGCTFDSRSTGTWTTNLGANSRVVLDRCQLFGSPGSYIQTLQCTPVPGSPGLVVGAGSTVEIANSTVTGGPPLSFLCLVSPGTNGLLVQSGGIARISHSSVAGGGPTVSAVTGGGAVLVDSVQFAPAFTGGSAAFLPIVTGQGAAPGGALQATLTSGQLLPGAVVASIGLRAPVPVSFGSAWVDPGAFVVLAIGLLDANGHLPVSVPVPPGVMRGLVLTFQGVAAPGASAALVASTPTMAHVL
jgi:hypothetical protein